MANFTRSLQKSNMLDQMAQQLAVAEMAEARAVFAIACYEAVHGPLAPDFLKEVQELIKDAKPKTKGDFYQTAYNAAKTVYIDREYAAATAEPMENEYSPTAANYLALAMAQGEARQSTQDSEQPAAPQTQSPASDTSDI